MIITIKKLDPQTEEEFYFIVVYSDFVYSEEIFI